MHAYTHARVLFARMFADTFQDPTASVGLFADLAGRQVGGHAHVRTYTQHARTHARTQACNHARPDAHMLAAAFHLTLS